MAKEEPAAQEPLLTKFFVYETTDGGRTLHLRGDQLAKERDQAVRLLLGDPNETIVGTYAAISENALKLKSVEIRPTARFSDVELPSLAPTEPPEPEPALAQEA